MRLAHTNATRTTCLYLPVNMNHLDFISICATSVTSTFDVESPYFFYPYHLSIPLVAHELLPYSPFPPFHYGRKQEKTQTK